MSEITIKPGQVWREYYNEGNRNNKLLHVRAVVDDDYIVVRYWRRVRWNYSIEWREFFEVGVECGHVRLEKDA